MEGDAAMAEAVAANPKIEASRDGLYEYKVGLLKVGGLCALHQCLKE